MNNYKVKTSTFCPLFLGFKKMSMPFNKFQAEGRRTLTVLTLVIVLLFFSPITSFTLFTTNHASGTSSRYYHDDNMYLNHPLKVALLQPRRQTNLYSFSQQGNTEKENSRIISKQHETKPLKNNSRRNFLKQMGLLPPRLAGIVSSLSCVDQAQAAFVQFPCTKQLMNTYHIMRSGESLLEAEDIWSTNPLFLTNREAALSDLGRLQIEKTCQTLISQGISPTAGRYSLAAACMDSAEIIGRKLKMPSDKLMPEFTYMDPRAIGMWDRSSIKDTEAVLWAMDTDEAGINGIGGKPPPTDDGTPNETLAEQGVRLRQLLSVLETLHSGDTILLIFPDGSTPALLSCLIGGIPLNRVHEFNFKSGEVRLNINYESVNKMTPTKASEAYTETINHGREQLTIIRDGNGKNVVFNEDIKYVEEVTQRDDNMSSVQNVVQVEKDKGSESKTIRRKAVEDEKRRRQIQVKQKKQISEKDVVVKNPSTMENGKISQTRVKQEKIKMKEEQIKPREEVAVKIPSIIENGQLSQEQVKQEKIKMKEEQLKLREEGRKRKEADVRNKFEEANNNAKIQNEIKKKREQELIEKEKNRRVELSLMKEKLDSERSILKEKVEAERRQNIEESDKSNNEGAFFFDGDIQIIGSTLVGAAGAFAIFQDDDETSIDDALNNNENMTRTVYEIDSSKKFTDDETSMNNKTVHIEGVIPKESDLNMEHIVEEAYNSTNITAKVRQSLQLNHFNINDRANSTLNESENKELVINITLDDSSVKNQDQSGNDKVAKGVLLENNTLSLNEKELKESKIEHINEIFNLVQNVSASGMIQKNVSISNESEELELLEEQSLSNINRRNHKSRLTENPAVTADQVLELTRNVSLSSLSTKSQDNFKSERVEEDDLINNLMLNNVKEERLNTKLHDRKPIETMNDGIIQVENSDIFAQLTVVKESASIEMNNEKNDGITTTEYLGDDMNDNEDDGYDSWLSVLSDIITEDDDSEPENIF